MITQTEIVIGICIFISYLTGFYAHYKITNVYRKKTGLRELPFFNIYKD